MMATPTHALHVTKTNSTNTTTNFPAATTTKLSLPPSPLCLDLSHLVVNQVTMATCDIRSPTQRWTFTYKFDVQRMQTNYP